MCGIFFNFRKRRILTFGELSTKRFIPQLVVLFVCANYKCPVKERVLCRNYDNKIGAC